MQNDFSDPDSPPTEARGMLPETRPVGVLLVDDQPLVRAGLKMILGPEDGFLILGEYADGAELLRWLLRQQLTGRKDADDELHSLRLTAMLGSVEEPGPSGPWLWPSRQRGIQEALAQEQEGGGVVRACSN